MSWEEMASTLPNPLVVASAYRASWLHRSIHRLIRLCENVRLARIELTLDARDNPISGQDEMATLQGLNPATSCCLFFASPCWMIAGNLKYGRMVAMFVPLCCFNYYWLLSEFHGSIAFCRAARYRSRVLGDIIPKSSQPM